MVCWRALKEDFHSLIFIFVCGWVLYESWEIKNRGLVGIVGKEKEERNAKNAKYDFCIFALLCIFCAYVCVHATKNNAIDDVHLCTHASEQCDR